MTIRSYCKICKPHVISEVIDGEAIIVNLETGAYFSLQGTAGFIWKLIEQEVPIDNIKRHLVVQYDGDEAMIESSLFQVIGELEQEQLISLEPVTNDVSPPAFSVQSPDKPQPYEKPVLVKYTDMAELLLLDPIHDVDELGWPHAGNVSPDGQS